MLIYQEKEPLNSYEIRNVKVTDVQMGQECSDYRGYAIIITFSASNLTQGFILNLNKSSVYTTLEAIDKVCGDLCKLKGKLFRIARHDGLIKGVGNIIEDKWAIFHELEEYK